MIILFLQIINIESQKIIGNYESNELKDTILKNEIENKSKELISQIKLENNSVKKHISLKSFSNVSLEIYYLLTNSNILYLSFNKFPSDNSLEFKDNYIFELLENIDSQNIIKFVDENNKLTNVGQQNLRMCIDKYYNALNYNAREIFVKNNSENKINKIYNEQRSEEEDERNETHNNIKDINEIEENSLNVRNTPEEIIDKNLQKKMKEEEERNKVITFFSVTSLLIMIIYILVK